MSVPVLGVAFICIAIFCIVWGERFVLTPLALTMLSLAPVLFGYATLDVANGSNTVWMYGPAVVLFAVGYLLSRGVLGRATRGARYLGPTARHGSRNSRAVVVFAIVTGSFTLFHLFMGGVPFLSENIEVARFDFTSSGLFGIPGRMFLFGMPFTVLMVSRSWMLAQTYVSRSLLYGVWSVYVCANMLSGFKGGLANVLIMVLLVFGLSGRPVPLRRLFVGWTGVLLAAAVLFSSVVAMRYKSIRLDGIEDIVPYLSERATVNAASPGYFALGRWGPGGTGGEQFSDDFAYFMAKYFGFLFASEGTAIPFDKTVSAALYHTPLSPDAFVVPVTIGAYPELVANFGVIIAMISMVVIGWTTAMLVVRAEWSTRMFGGTLCGFAVYLLRTYILNGNLMYMLFNWLVMSVMLAVLYWFCMVCVTVMERQGWKVEAAVGRVEGFVRPLE